MLSCILALSVKYRPVDVSLTVSCGLPPVLLELCGNQWQMAPHSLPPPLPAPHSLQLEHLNTILEVSSWRLMQIVAVTVGWEWYTVSAKFFVGFFFQFSKTSTIYYRCVFGPILDDRLKEKLLKPWKGALSSHFHVCLSVCLSVFTRATGHTFCHRNLIFGFNDPWDMRKNTFFCFSKFSYFHF